MDTITPDHSCRERQIESALTALLDAYRGLRFAVMDGATKKCLIDRCHEIAQLETEHNRAICGR